MQPHATFGCSVSSDYPHTTKELPKVEGELAPRASLAPLGTSALDPDGSRAAGHTAPMLDVALGVSSITGGVRGQEVGLSSAP